MRAPMIVYLAEMLSVDALGTCVKMAVSRAWQRAPLTPAASALLMKTVLPLFVPPRGVGTNCSNLAQAYALNAFKAVRRVLANVRGVQRLAEMVDAFTAVMMQRLRSFKLQGQRISVRPLIAITL